jgi:hypothetical protein
MLRLKTTLEQNEFEAYVEALFKLDHYHSIYKELDRLEVPAPYKLRIKVLYSEISLKKVIDSLVENGSLHNLKSDSKTYIYSTTIGRQIIKKVRVPFFLTSFDQNELRENVQAIVAICNTDQWRAIRRLSERNYPSLVPILLSQSEIIESAKRLKQMTGHNVNVKAFSAKEVFNGKKGEYFKSIREWTDEELDRALLSIKDRRQIIYSIDIEFFRRIGDQTHVVPSAICKIRKNGEIEVTGSYKLAFDAVAAQIAKVGLKKLSFYSGRGLRVSAYKPKPLAVNFSQPVFENVDAVSNFVHILSKYPHSMHAIEHGNPYAHVKLADIYDGSSFDVWAISPSRIALIPGLKASEAAFERLVHFIFDRFREGQIANYDYEGRTLEGN